MSLTTNPNDPALKEGQQNQTGQHAVYLVLSEDERAKGFVRPYRNTYIHIGRKTKVEGVIQPLEEQLENMSDFAKDLYTKENGYTAFIKYPDSELPVTGRFLKQDELDAINARKEYVGGCGTVTTMGSALAETYARDPKFYGATFCCGCNKHLPVTEFVWAGTTETVGS